MHFPVGFGGRCPTGHYCPKGSTLPIECPAGSYQDKEGQTNCKLCPAGYFCLAKASTYNDTICPSGRYCPVNTSVPILCQEGTFNNLTGQTEESNCVLCTAGKYCQGSGLSKPTADCYGGWYCVNGSTKPTPDLDCIRERLKLREQSFFLVEVHRETPETRESRLVSEIRETA